MKQPIRKRPRGRPKSIFNDAQPSTVKALDRGLMLLRELAQGGSVSLTNLALKVDMPASSAYRVLITLQKHRFVELDSSTQEWMIGIEAFRTGSAYLVRTNLVEAARKTMHRLMEATGETANLAIADDSDVVFISQVETHNPIRAFFRTGTRSHMHASGIGKALMANMEPEEVEKIMEKKGLEQFTSKTLTSPEALFTDLENIRKRSWSLDDEERHSGMRCVAAAIYNGLGEAVAGVSLSGPTVRLTDQSVSELGPLVKRAADEITVLIGGTVKPAL
jgi:IclR family transcriptional regulator, acetate operon repressor